MYMSVNLSTKYWTNPSVDLIAENYEPINFITEKARSLVFEAMRKGWSGPPFDPFRLADILKIDVIASEGVLDARTIPLANGKILIEFNPNRPKSRVNYSIAHELAHTLFPDCAEHIRERKAKNEMRADDWQLEMLCNIGASEFLMPIGSFPLCIETDVSIDSISKLTTQFDVSTEAILLRIARLAEKPFIAFCCSSIETKDKRHYKFDYILGSRGINKLPAIGSTLSKRSHIEEVTAIGYTAKGTEEWDGLGKVNIEAIGLPPYPEHLFPRSCRFCDAITFAKL